MSLTTRPHLYVPLVDETGALLRFARVQVYLEDGKTPYTGRIYRDGTSTKTYPNPFIGAPALISVYLQSPARVRLGITADTSKPEIIGDVINVDFDADQTVDTLNALYITGNWSVGGLLCGQDPNTAFWKPLRVDHEHATIAPAAVLVGSSDALLRQAGTFPGSTVVGADSGGWGAASSLRDASMLGSLADGYGRGTTAIGHNAMAEEGASPPWPDGATALGRDTVAAASAVVLGSTANAGASSVAAGWNARAVAGSSVALGQGARPNTNGVAIGNQTGASASGMPGSIGLGAGAQYGLPSSTDPGDTSVLLGAYDPTRVRTFPWANPNLSQSESPFDEYAPVMQFTGRTVQLQRGLEWLADITGLQVGGNATLGGPTGVLGFYGTTPVLKQSLSDDEPGSGITALDNLIFALRDLGLVRYRTEASMVYRSEDVNRRYLDGDAVPAWDEHFGTDTARSVAASAPTYRGSNPSFNGHPTVGFDNSVYRRSTRPVQELRGANLLPNEKHFIAVAGHSTYDFGFNEGLLNLAYLTKIVSDDTSVLTSDSSTTWSGTNLTRYEIDGLNQSGNRQAGLPGPHVYSVSHPTAWPHARPVIGGPRDNDNAGWDRWSGQIAELVAMDNSWEAKHVQSMAAGLAFKYGINQNQNNLRNPSQDFLLTQHDPMNGTLVFFTKDYPSNYVGKVQGRATRVPKPVIYVPFISIYIAFSFYYFRGALLGNWGNIGFWSDYEVAISVKIGDLDGDGDIDVDVDFDVHTETHIGIFSLNNNLTWTMGRLSCDYGYKVCRIRHRITKEVICISGDPPFRYADTDVKIYTTKPDGSLLLEATTPLWGDGTFKAWTYTAGKKVARVIERSTGNTLGTTEYQEKALPRTQLYADDDSEVSFANRDKALVSESALTALAILEMPVQYQYRARHILSTLQIVCNNDGSLNESYSSVLPAKTGRPAGESPGRWGAVWTILAVLRYQQATGDGQFLAFARKVADFLITDTVTETRTIAVSYFAFRDLAAITGVASYSTAAQNARIALLGPLWLPTPGRFKETTTTDAEGLWGDLMGGMFLIAIGDRAKARSVVRQLKRYRVKNGQVNAPHYTGQSGLLGYKPYADMGAQPRINPPTVIDQAGSWAAVLFKLRYGEPAGDDVSSLFRWAQTSIYNDPTHDLYAAQFLRYSANATASGYNLRARPHLASATWGHLLAAGARYLLTPDPLPAPVPTVLTLNASRDVTSGRFVFRYTWLVDPAVPASAYESVPEMSTNSSTTWMALSSGSVRAPLAGVVDTTVGPNGYAASWSIPAPDNVATLYRVRLRIRNASFGSWITSASTGLPV